VSGYAHPVRIMLARFALLIAVLLMPFGMAPAAAAPKHAMAMGMPMGHCPDQSPHHDMKGGIAECTMACAGALPAADLADHQPLLITSKPIVFTAAQRLDGLHPETATPPPKHS
jgi:hypothetical protein